MSTQTAQQSPLLLEILPGTLFFSQFMKPESGSTTQHDVGSRDNGQIQFRSTSPVRWLQNMGVPNPTSINWEGEVLTNVEKNAKGDIFIEYVNKKRKVTVSWQFLTQIEYNRLLDQLRIDFRVSHQNFLYYRIRTVNPNGVRDIGLPTNADEPVQDAVTNRTPQRDTIVAYLDGKHTGNIKMYHEGDNLLIGYGDVSLTFIER